MIDYTLMKKLKDAAENVKSDTTTVAQDIFIDTIVECIEQLNSSVDPRALSGQ